VEGEIVPYRSGRPVLRQEFFGQLAREDIPAVEIMSCALHLRNRSNIGVEALDLHFKYDPRFAGEASPAGLLLGQIAESEVDPRTLLVEIIEPGALEPLALSRLASEMRSLGIRLAIDGFGAEPVTQEIFDLLRPDVFRIDGVRLLTLCRDAATARLLALLVSSLRDRGSKLLVAGIEDAEHLRAALLAGADLLSGDHLAPSAPVGTVFDETPVSIAGLTALEPNVVRFAHPTHQPR
jgi:EAL domain-containing protein (putative c-di-GMP-specific phosphodiesterase class I)